VNLRRHPIGAKDEGVVGLNDSASTEQEHGVRTFVDHLELEDNLCHLHASVLGPRQLE
jgi:hypothetical protein